MLTSDQHAQFARTGILRLPAAFSAESATSMRAVAWREMERRHGMRCDDPATWRAGGAWGMQSTKKSRAFLPILGDAVCGVLDDLFGPDAWQRPKTLGNVLITMPNANHWQLPHRLWHTDFQATYPAEPLMAVKVWALFGDVAPGGGGTPQLAGSHRLFAAT